MSMYTALSGLNAAQKDISITSNNIANVGTTGFKDSRAEFGDIFNSSPYSSPTHRVGSGVKLLDIRQNFSQGTLQNTENTFDLALEGQGFFAVQGDLEGGEPLYTRAGAFGMDADGNVVNSAGNYLMTYPVAQDGSVISTDLSMTRPVNVPMYAGNATATSNIDMEVDFSSGVSGLGLQDAVPPTVAFDPTNATTYANSTPVSVFDGDGNQVEAQVYFVKTAEPDATTTDTTYEAHMVLDGEVMALGTPGSNVLTFDPFGAPTTAIAPMSFSTGTSSMTLDLAGSSLTSENFSIASVAQDGEAPSGLTGIDVDGSGTIWASYAGREAVALGKVAVANFNNAQGLKQIGNATFQATGDSGRPIAGIAGEDGFGSLRAGALENANVDLTEELVHLITAQRNYQASAKALETNSAVTQTIMNMRS